MYLLCHCERSEAIWFRGYNNKIAAAYGLAMTCKTGLEFLDSRNLRIEVISMGIIDLIIGILLIIWIGGFALHIAGGFIHLLLLIALVLLIVRIFKKVA